MFTFLRLAEYYLIFTGVVCFFGFMTAGGAFGGDVIHDAAAIGSFGAIFSLLTALALHYAIGD